MRAIAEDSVSPAMALCGIVADDGREAANGGRWSMTDTAISLLVAVLLLPGIGSGVAAARARRRGDPRRSLRLRLILPALFFAGTLLNASYPWQHRAQRLVAVSLGGVVAAAWALAAWRALRRETGDGDAARG